MDVETTLSGFTVAEYCDQMREGHIIINRDYQRSPKVWPTAARSYLIDTILSGYPIPKVSLFQKTDLKSRRTIKEIVDGQQRSQAILDFFEDKLRIGGSESEFAGRVFSSLEEPDQARFLAYHIAADLFVHATDEDIRQLFRRMNSYTVPLNPEEQRHATYQGAFKWYIVRAIKEYSGFLKEIGTFSERAMVRMQDAKLFTELCLAIEEGVETSSRSRLNSIYRRHDQVFPRSDEIRTRFRAVFDRVGLWRKLVNTPLVKHYNIYSLVLAMTHIARPVSTLGSVFAMKGKAQYSAYAEENLLVLAATLEEGEEEGGEYGEFIRACSGATNTREARVTRMRWFCRALLDQDFR